tara:strand:- start:2735 stop:3835 length:1101 start_codon:yes stop_codon:yes gene_type:complete
MATTFKTLTANDITNTRTLLHEAIPLTGTISSGTYNAEGSDENIKTFSHGMFESVFDYPYLSSSANHIYDISYGISTGSVFSASTTIQGAKKVNIYNQMASVLVGHDSVGKIQRFDQDGDLAGGGFKINDAVFFNFSRLLVKDEIKKGSFSLQFLTGATPLPLARTHPVTISDYQASSSYLVNSPAGEYGLLYTSSSPDNTFPVGLVYYQAGVAVLTGACFSASSNAGNDSKDGGGLPLQHTVIRMGPGYDSSSYQGLATGSTIETMADSVRNRIVNVSFNNTVELNSTIYFCRANHDEFNYSSNPTYLTASQIRVKNTTTDNPVAYITTVGLYSSDNELMAVAKLSEPLKKDPSTELTLRVRLDY